VDTRVLNSTQSALMYTKYHHTWTETKKTATAAHKQQQKNKKCDFLTHADQKK